MGSAEEDRTGPQAALMSFAPPSSDRAPGWPIRRPAPSRRCSIEIVGQLLAPAVVPYIYRDVLNSILRFSDGGDRHERGGFLLGGYFEDEGEYVEITHFLPAQHTDSSAAQLTFTHETWSQLNREVERRDDGQKVVGWQHTHPNLGVFLSQYDRFIHQHFFSAPWQVALVVDPRRGEFAFFQWSGSAIEDCGFVLVHGVPPERLPTR